MGTGESSSRCFAYARESATHHRPSLIKIGDTERAQHVADDAGDKSACNVDVDSEAANECGCLRRRSNPTPNSHHQVVLEPSIRSYQAPT
jgi:hypothetical protein